MTEKRIDISLDRMPDQDSAAEIEATLLALEGVTAVVLSERDRRIEVAYDVTRLDVSDVVKALEVITIIDYFEETDI